MAMPNAAIGVTEGLLKTVGSLIAEEVRLAWGMKKQLRKVALKLERIKVLLSDAQSKEITMRAVQLWLKKLQLVALDAQILLEKFSYQVLCRKVESRNRDKVRRSFSSSNAVFVSSKMALKLKDVLSSLDELLNEATGFGFQPVLLDNSLPDLKVAGLTVPHFDDSMVVGREDAVANVIRMLTKSYDERALPVVTVLGMGGLGKTTVSQMACKSDVVKSYFDVQIWVCVSDDFNAKRLLAEMQPLTLVNYQSASLVDLVRKLKVTLEGKKYLLVLDDVWNEDGEEWERMRSCLLRVGGARGSKILVTTRNEGVGRTMRSSDYLHLGVLSEDKSKELFEKCAFAEGGPTKTPQLLEIGGRILKRCGGVPLAIKTIGGSLYSMNFEAYWSWTERSDMWSTYSGGDTVLAAIKLSYDQLPSLSVQQCFAYCAIFEKDRVMEKDELIQLWMAQGFLNVPKGSHLQMEDVGDMYYKILLRNSLFQEATDYAFQCCKMHDLVHDFSLRISESYCLQINDCKASSNGLDAVHVSVTTSEKGQLKSSKGLPSNLRTLYLKTTIELPEDLFQNLESVVALTIENRDAEELPNSVRKMNLLRFLDFSRTSITKLPRWLTKLYHLQTLRVDCLAEVPKGFKNLINLRHIHFMNNYPYDEANCLFKGLGQLRNLQTLPYFRVGRSEDGCPIGELECLNNLRERLRIFGLENVGSYESAAKSKLSNKSNIRALELHWDGKRDDNCDDGDVAEGLKPCSTVTDLLIRGFRGSNCPSWVEKGNLGNLVRLRLMDLNKCVELPSFGNLPCLEDLHIRNLPNVRSIGQEFYGPSNVVSRGSEIIVFPALKTFRIEYMESLMEWSSVQVTMFPKLEHLGMYELPNLRVFPNLGTLPSLSDLGSLVKLELVGLYTCHKLPSLGDLPFLEDLFICNLPNVRSIGQEFYGLSNVVSRGSEIIVFPALRTFEIRHMESLMEWSDAKGIISSSSVQVTVFPNLEHLRMYGLPKLHDFPNLGTLPSLTELEVVGCKYMKNFQVELQPKIAHIPNLDI